MKKNFFIVLLLILLLNSCSYKNIIDETTSPIPPFEYYKIFINNFEKNVTIDVSDTNYINWFNSKLIYQTWKNKQNDFSLTYKALYLMNFQKAIFFDDYTQYREVIFDTNNNTYRFLLYSTNYRDNVEWEMQQFVNNSTKYSVALKGTNINTNENGKWTFYQTQNLNIPKLVVYWKQKDSSLQVIFSDIDTNQIEKSYLKITDNYFENSYSIKIENFDFNTKNIQFIELSKQENFGKIKDTLFYKDNKWHFWSL